MSISEFQNLINCFHPPSKSHTDTITMDNGQETLNCIKTYTKTEAKICLMHYLPIPNILIILAQYGNLQQTTPNRTFFKRPITVMQEKRNVCVLSEVEGMPGVEYNSCSVPLQLPGSCASVCLPE